jgi:hypothetical protein
MAKMERKSGSARRARRSAGEWRAEVGAWRASALSATQYAKDHGLHAGTLLGWSSRLVKAAEEGGRDAGTSRARGSLFVPVTVTGQAAGSEPHARLCAEVVLAGGRRVRLSGEFGIAQLGRLLDAVEGTSRC